MTDTFIDDFDEEYEGVEVELPSGSSWTVLTDDEKEYVLNKSHQYQDHNRFQNISDLQDLDRIIQLETLIWRWNQWISLERDYFGRVELDPRMQENALKAMKEVRDLKKNIGVDKASRDKERGESVASYIENLGMRAKEFGVMRDNQAEKSITLFRELLALVTLHDNCTEEERSKQGVKPEEILAWVRRVKPEFDEIDKAFREGSQKYWIRSQ